MPIGGANKPSFEPVPLPFSPNPPPTNPSLNHYRRCPYATSLNTLNHCGRSDPTGAPRPIYCVRGPAVSNLLAALKRPVQSSDPPSIGSIGPANNAKVALTELGQCLQSTIDRCQQRTFLSNFQEWPPRHGHRADQEGPTSRDHRLTRVNLVRFRSEFARTVRTVTSITGDF